MPTPPRHYKDELQDWLDGRLDAARCDEVERHLETCAECRRDRFNPCGLTASGEAFRPNDADNAASPIYPEGTVLLVRNPSNGEAADWELRARTLIQ